MHAPSFATRRRLAPLVVVVASAASIATSQASWSVESHAVGQPLVLAGGAGATSTAVRRIEVRANEPVIASREAQSQGVSLAVTAHAQGTISGTPRPAELRVVLEPEDPRGATPSSHFRDVASAYVRCERAQPCTRVFRLTVTWADAPAGQTAQVAWSIDASARTRGGSNAPPGAAVLVRELGPATP